MSVNVAEYWKMVRRQVANFKVIKFKLKFMEEGRACFLVRCRFESTEYFLSRLASSW